jgi:hypothetical protein
VDVELDLKANRRISNKKYRMMKCGIALGLHSFFSDEGALSLFSKMIMTEYLTSTLVRRRVRFYKVSFSIKLTALPRRVNFSGQRRRLYLNSSVNE